MLIINFVVHIYTHTDKIKGCQPVYNPEQFPCIFQNEMSLSAGEEQPTGWQEHPNEQ